MAQPGARGRDRRPRKEHPHKINEQVRADQVRLIGEDGQQLGVMDIRKAVRMSRDAKLDLVLIAENADPPVCRLMNYSKFLYQQERKAKDARKHRPKPPHELRLRPAIADADFHTKLRQAEKFLGKGDKVKLTVQFRGRQNAHPGLGIALLDRFADALSEVAVVDQRTGKEGNRMHMMLVPKNSSRATTDKQPSP